MVQTSSSQRSRRADRRLEILKGAAEVFREKGYHGAGMREIAERLGVAPGALYYYFESKEDLLQACQEMSLDRMLAGGRAIAASDLPADERLRRLVSMHLGLTLDVLGGSAAHVEFRALPPERLRQVVRKRDAYERLVTGLVAAGVEDGTFRPVDPRLTALALLGALNWTVVWWRPDGRWTPAHLVEGFLDVFLNGLVADGSPGAATAPETGR